MRSMNVVRVGLCVHDCDLSPQCHFGLCHDFKADERKQLLKDKLVGAVCNHEYSDVLFVLEEELKVAMATDNLVDLCRSVWCCNKDNRIPCYVEC